MGRKDKPISSEQALALTTGARLRYARQEKNVTLSKMAETLNYSKGYLSSIENGNLRVSAELLRRYEQVLELPIGELGELEGNSSEKRKDGSDSEERPWNVPYRRNLFFTGREDCFQEIRKRLEDKIIQPSVLAITGLGGIGKTQLCIEYAYRYRSDYQGVLWIEADTALTLTEHAGDLAKTLMRSKQEDLKDAMGEISSWLQTHPGSLLIFDNVGNTALLDEILPTLGQNTILISTRSQIVGPGTQTLELRELTEPEGAMLLLRRAKLAAPRGAMEQIPENMLNQAHEIADLMGGLPLALNQAGSYIERTHCGLLRYTDLLKGQHARMLSEQDQQGEYPASVASTWSISLESLSRSNPAAVELLYLCAFFHSETIYEQMIIAGREALPAQLQICAGDELELTRIFGELRAFSLLRMNAEGKACSMHRLLQVVIRDTLSFDKQRYWTECAVRVIAQAFPCVEVTNWQETWAHCQRYYLQAEQCFAWIKRWQLEGEDSVRLLRHVGRYLEERKDLRGAERRYKQALEMNTRLLGEEDSRLVPDLHNLARVLTALKKEDLASEMYKRALILLEQAGELTQLDIALLEDYIRLLGSLQQEKEIAWLNSRSIFQAGTIRERLKRTTVNDDDTRIHYDEKWRGETRLKSDDYNNDVHVSHEIGATFTFPFTGVGIEIIADTSSAHGELDIYLDGSYVQTVKTARIENQLTQTIIFSKTDLESEQHTLQVTLTGGTCIVDALAIFAYAEEEINQ